MNLSGDDEIRNKRERGGNQHGPLAWIVGIGDCDLIHGVEVTGACRCSDEPGDESRQGGGEGAASIRTGQLGWLSQHCDRGTLIQGRPTSPVAGGPGDNR